MDELEAAVAKRRANAEEGAASNAVDPRLEREAELRKKRHDMLRGIRSSGHNMLRRRSTRRSNKLAEPVGGGDSSVGKATTDPEPDTEMQYV